MIQKGSKVLCYNILISLFWAKGTYVPTGPAQSVTFCAAMAAGHNRLRDCVCMTQSAETFTETLVLKTSTKQRSALIYNRPQNHPSIMLYVTF